MSLSETTSKLTQTDFLSPNFYENPYPYYEFLRDTDPIHWDTTLDKWLVTSYEDVSNILRDPNFKVKREKRKIAALPENQKIELSRLQSFYSHWLLYSDPPEHTKLRRSVGKAFTPHEQGLRRDLIQNRAEELTSNFTQESNIDLHNNFAVPLSITVISDLFGIPSGQYTKIKEWSDYIVDYVVGRSTGYEKGILALNSVNELSIFLEELLEFPREHDESSIIGCLTNALFNNLITKEEAVAVAGNILIDGHEPIANGISNGVNVLLDNTDQLELLVRNPLLIGPAVDEVLRYESPFQFAQRVASEDVNIKGKKINKGDRILLMLGSANRDPKVYNSPNQFDVTRSPNKHLAFGLGTHFCLGAPLAKPSLEIAISTLINKFPSIRKNSDPPEWQSTLAVRGLKSLSVAL